MKPFYSALLLSCCIALGASAPAQAEARPHSGTSSSYKSGFSSQKSNTARSRPSAPPANRQSGPGAFGQAPGSPASATPRNASAASRDIDRSAAQARALRNLEDRRAADTARAGAPTPLPPLNDTPMRPSTPAQQSARGGATAQPAYPQPAYPQPVVVQQPSGGGAWMHGALGFMLGRAMSQANQPVAYPTTTGGAPTSTSAQAPAPAPAPAPALIPAINQAGQVTGMPGLGDPSPSNARTPAPPQPSFGAGVLRWFVWLGLLSAIAWAAVYAVGKLRRARAARRPNYSFEGN